MWTFTKQAAISIVRTVAAYVYAWLLSFTVVADFFTELNLSEEAFVVFAGTLVYVLIRQLAEYLPWLGNLLVFNTAPDYDESK